MKISVPWPVKTSSQPRIEEALGLWEHPEWLTLCLAEPSPSPFLNDFDTYLLPRNSKSIGTRIAKCFITDMVQGIRERHPDEDWYGFGNSDVVPVDDLTVGYEDQQVLVFHRVNIRLWEYRKQTDLKPVIDASVMDAIWSMRQKGFDDRRIARDLNIRNVPPLPGEQEWTYLSLRNLLENRGELFFWGQDMYLFRADVVDRVLEEYLKVADPILGTGGFDPRLTRWCLDHFKGVRVLDRIFHKEHPSEWSVDEVEYVHNGGDIPVEEQHIYYDYALLAAVQKQGQLGCVPKYIRYLHSRDNPVVRDVLFHGQ